MVFLFVDLLACWTNEEKITRLRKPPLRQQLEMASRVCRPPLAQARQQVNAFVAIISPFTAHVLIWRFGVMWHLIRSNNEILFPPKVSDSAAKFSFTSALSLITWHLTVKLFSVKSLRISSFFVNFVVAEIFPGNGLLTSKSETVYFLNSAFEQWRWRMKMHCYPRMLNATFAAILDLLTSLLCHITRPFHSSSSTQHLSKTALVVID